MNEIYDKVIEVLEKLKKSQLGKAVDDLGSMGEESEKPIDPRMGMVSMIIGMEKMGVLGEAIEKVKNLKEHSSVDDKERFAVTFTKVEGDDGKET